MLIKLGRLGRLGGVGGSVVNVIYNIAFRFTSAGNRRVTSNGDVRISHV